MRFDAAQFLGSLYDPDPEQAEGSPVLTAEQRLFLGQWRSEIATMRRGDNPDWISWSPACRSKWAESMLALLTEAGIPRDQAGEEVRWLVRICKGEGFSA